MVVPHSSVHLRSVADELEDIGVLFAVDIESVPFFPGLRIYSVSKEIFPVIRQVDIGKLDTTAPEATSANLPIVFPQTIVAFAPIDAPSFTKVFL